jgi:hypothetical protein
MDFGRFKSCCFYTWSAFCAIFRNKWSIWNGRDEIGRRTSMVIASLSRSLLFSLPFSEVAALDSGAGVSDSRVAAASCSDGGTGVSCCDVVISLSSSAAGAVLRRASLLREGMAVIRGD